MLLFYFGSSKIFYVCLSLRSRQAEFPSTFRQAYSLFLGPYLLLRCNPFALKLIPSVFLFAFLLFVYHSASCLSKRFLNMKLLPSASPPPKQSTRSFESFHSHMQLARCQTLLNLVIPINKSPLCQSNKPALQIIAQIRILLSGMLIHTKKVKTNNFNSNHGKFNS